MRLLLALAAVASLAACSKNHANVKTGPETGRVSTDTATTTGTVDTSGTAIGKAEGTATGTVDTSGTATGSATGSATGTVDTSGASGAISDSASTQTKPDSM